MHSEEQFRIPAPVMHVMNKIEEAGYQAWLVGGCVRDLLRHKEPHDYDLATSARPQIIQQLFKKHADTGLKHGTVMVIEEGIPIEVTTFRKEGTYSDGRHPDQVEFVDDIQEDLARRDFTVNAMAWNPENGLLDPFGGQKDLEEGIIRAVGDPDRRFEEDALRMIRAWRFAAQLGFRIEEQTLKALHKEDNTARIEKISAERIFEELNKILISDHPEVIAEMTDLLWPWIPELKIMLECDQINPHHYTDVLHHTLDAIRRSGSDDPMVRFALLLHDAGKPATKTTDARGDHFKKHPIESAKIARRVLRRLHAPKKWQEEIPALILRHDAFYAPNLSNIAKLRITLGWDDEQVQKLFEVQRGDILAHTSFERLDLLKEFRDFYDLEKSRRPLSVGELAVNGHDVMEHTSLRNRQIGLALEKLLMLAFYHPELNRREDLLARLPQIEAQVLSEQNRAGDKK